MIRCQKNREREDIIVTDKKDKREKKSIEYNYLKTGNCKMSPFTASEICAEKRNNQHPDCKGCWMNK
jgi:hypothetical protein